MGNITWCDNCGKITNNNKLGGGYRNRVGCEDVPAAVWLCDECEDDMIEDLAAVFEKYDNENYPIK